MHYNVDGGFPFPFHFLYCAHAVFTTTIHLVIVLKLNIKVIILKCAHSQIGLERLNTTLSLGVTHTKTWQRGKGTMHRKALSVLSRRLRKQLAWLEITGGGSRGGHFLGMLGEETYFCVGN